MRSSTPRNHLIDVIRSTSPALQLAHAVGHISILDISTLSRSVLQRDVVVLGDEQALTGSAFGSAFLHVERSAVLPQSRTELDAQLGVGELNGGGAGRVEELLSGGIVASRSGEY